MIPPEVSTVSKKLCICFAVLAMTSAVLFAQDKAQAPATTAANPITQSEKGLYLFLSNNVVRAAEKMPEENYSFKPTPDVRSFGQLVGHVADANYMFCALASGEANPAKNIEKTKTTKADLVAAVKDAVAYCGKTFDGMSDSKGSETVKFMSFNLARLSMLSLNTAHTDEHYGNMVTYFRIKGIVPPSSESQAPARTQK